MEGLDTRIDLHCLQTAESSDGTTGRRYASGLRCVNSSTKLQNSEFIARSKIAASISAGTSRDHETKPRPALNRGVSPTCTAARELPLEIASEHRGTSGTASSPPTSSWRRRFFWLIAFGGTVGLFSFACIEACIAGSSEINEARFVCPLMAYSRTNFAASLSVGSQNEEGEDGLRDILSFRWPNGGRRKKEGARSDRQCHTYLVYSCAHCT